MEIRKYLNQLFCQCIFEAKILICCVYGAKIYLLVFQIARYNIEFNYFQN